MKIKTFIDEVRKRVVVGDLSGGFPKLFVSVIELTCC
jgi:hypothetical protein